MTNARERRIATLVLCGLLAAPAGAKERVVVGHDPEVAARFDQVEPGIIKIA